MKANISAENLAELCHQLEAAKGLATAAIREAARLSSRDKPLDLRRVRADALRAFDEHLKTAPDQESRAAAQAVGERTVEQFIGMIEAMGSQPNQ